MKKYNRRKRHRTKKRKSTQKPFNREKYTNSHMLIASSLLFITNALAAFYKQYYLYGSLFVVLTTSSVVFHSRVLTPPPHYFTHEFFILLPNIIDKLAILSVVFYGGRMLYTKQSDPESNTIVGAIIVFTLLFCIGVYYYGYICNKYCFDQDPNIGNEYHALLHIIASIGHHMIILS